MSEPVNEIDDFETLSCRHVGGHQFRVLNREKGTVAKVDVHDLTCSCEYSHYDAPGDRDVCKHVSYALFQAPEARIEVSQNLVHDLSNLIVDLSAAAEKAEDAAHEFDGALVSQRAEEAEQAAQNSTDTFDGDPVDEFNSLLRDAGLDPDDFEVWVSDQFGSLQVDVDGYLDDDEFSTWVDFSNGLEMSYDGDDDINFIQSDRFPEVFG